MNTERIQTISDIIRNYNQFDPDSQLFRDIQAVTGCRKSEIAGIADGHCNLISTWAIMFASGKTEMSYRDYFSKCLTTDVYDKKNKYTSKGCNVEGKIQVGKEYLLPAIFGVDFNPVFYEDFEDVINPSARLNPDCFYQMKIQNSDHYIACCIDKNGLFVIFDTGRRGVNVPAIGANRINEKYFKWLLEFPCS